MFTLDLPELLARAIALLLGFGVHEAAHAWAAYRLGDDTAKRAGRLTLNPLAHLDPLGALMALFAMFGWAKPVPVNPLRLRFGPRTGLALVSVAGPASNLLVAGLVALPWRLGLIHNAPEVVLLLVWVIVAMNVGLALFNLIPLAPLDGHSVLNGILEPRLAERVQALQVYGPMILLGLLMLGRISPSLDILGRTLYPAAIATMRFMFGL
ncbi:MAG: site-2 protease family protein [Chloroflexi bacterium]|nr:site-2 protease family protein [Chloroflexota bacterium]